MICLPPSEIERRFALLGIPNQFSKTEKQALATTPIVEPGERVFGFPTPEANAGLNLLNLREILGTDRAKPPSFFDHPWYLNEPFGRDDCDPGWHFLYTEVLPDSISQPVDYASSLTRQGLELPTATEVVLMLFLHYAGSGEQLLQLPRPGREGTQGTPPPRHSRGRSRAQETRSRHRPRQAAGE